MTEDESVSVRLTHQPHVEVKVSLREYDSLRRQGLIVQDKPKPKAGQEAAK